MNIQPPTHTQSLRRSLVPAAQIESIETTLPDGSLWSLDDQCCTSRSDMQACNRKASVRAAIICLENDRLMRLPQHPRQGMNTPIATAANPAAQEVLEVLCRRYAHLRTPIHSTNPDHLPPTPVKSTTAPLRLAKRYAKDRADAHGPDRRGARLTGVFYGALRHRRGSYRA
jgi:hypothetical protein